MYYKEQKQMRGQDMRGKIAKLLRREAWVFAYGKGLDVGRVYEEMKKAWQEAKKNGG